MVEIEMHACEATIELLFVSYGFLQPMALSSKRSFGLRLKGRCLSHTASDDSDGFKIVNLPVQLPIDDPLL